MSSDEIVWQVINQQFCSFKLKYAPIPFRSLLNLTTAELPKKRTSVAMNTTSLASAIDSHVLLRIPAMLPFAHIPAQEPSTST